MCRNVPASSYVGWLTDNLGKRHRNAQQGPRLDYEPR